VDRRTVTRIGVRRLRVWIAENAAGSAHRLTRPSNAFHASFALFLTPPRLLPHALVLLYILPPLHRSQLRPTPPLAAQRVLHTVVAASESRFPEAKGVP